MSDGLTLNAGSGGSTLATDDAGVAGHVQIVKLALSADGSATPLTADNTDGLLVKLSAQGGTDLMDVTVNNGDGVASVPVQGAAAAGAALAANPVTIGVSDGTLVQVPRVYDTDSGAGTEYTLGVQIRGAASGGSEAIGGDAANGLDVDVTRVGGNVTVVQGTGSNLHVVVDSGTITTVTTVTTVSAVTAITNALPAGDNNVGNVDIVTLPAGNLGQQAMAASLSVVPASDVTDATYIGDIKFGEALPAGTAAIGKLLPPDVDVSTHTNYIKKYYTNAGAVTDGIVWSPAVGKRWHIVLLYVYLSAAGTVTLEDDLAGGDSAVWAAEFDASKGAVLPFSEKYPLASGEDAADLIITTTAGNVYLTAVGYEV